MVAAFSMFPGAVEMGVVILWPGIEEALHRPDGVTDGYDLTGATIIDVPEGWSWAGKAVDWATLTIVDDVAAAREALWEAVKGKCEAVASGGCIVPSLGPIDTTSESRILILGSLETAKILGDAYSDVWTMADNSHLPIDGTGILAISLAAGAHIQACWARRRALRDAIDAAATRAELDAIDITTGWPGQ
jgi:Domain of unknown function (DUF4376)